MTSHHPVSESAQDSFVTESSWGPKAPEGRSEELLPQTRALPFWEACVSVNEAQAGKVHRYNCPVRTLLFPPLHPLSRHRPPALVQGQCEPVRIPEHLFCVLGTGLQKQMVCGSALTVF